MGVRPVRSRARAEGLGVSPKLCGSLRQVAAGDAVIVLWAAASSGNKWPAAGVSAKFSGSGQNRLIFNLGSVTQLARTFITQYAQRLCQYTDT